MLVNFNGISPTPGATVTVRLAGSATPVPIYADADLTPLGNPFTADLLTGLYSFWADLELLDITISTGNALPSDRKPNLPEVIFTGLSPNRVASIIVEDRCQLITLVQTAPY